MKETLNLRTDSQRAMQEIMDKHLRPSMILYDVGCGQKPFASFLRGKVAKHIGIDIDNGFYDRTHIDIFGSADNLPIPNASADAILSSQVIEHIPDAEKSIAEAARALKPGGLLFLSYPYLYPIHAPPYDFARLSRFAIDRILEHHQLKLVERRTLGGFWYLIGTSMPIYLQNVPPIRTFHAQKTASFIIRFIFGILHKTEELIFKISKKNIDAARSSWPVAYVLVAKRDQISEACAIKQM